MSDNGNTTQECYVYLLPPQSEVVTPCIHPNPLRETCFLKIICQAYFREIATCSLCRTQWRPESESESEPEGEQETVSRFLVEIVPESEKDAQGNADRNTQNYYNIIINFNNYRVIRKFLTLSIFY